MNWKIASLPLLVACGTPLVGMTVSAQETDIDTTQTEAETGVDISTDTLEIVVVAEPDPETSLATDPSQEGRILAQQAQDLEDDLMSLYVSVLQKKCVEAGGTEKSCQTEAASQAGLVYAEAEAAAEESAH